MVNDRPIPSLDIAHISAAHLDGPRYRADMTDHERRDWPNLILLCAPHHRFIDHQRPGDYPAEILREWKFAREKGALDGLQDPSDEDFPAAMSEAMNEAIGELRAAIEQLKEINPDAARALVDINAADLLDSASHRLANRPGFRTIRLPCLFGGWGVASSSGGCTRSSACGRS
jgi:hypothetical protein